MEAIENVSIINAFIVKDSLNTKLNEKKRIFNSMVLTEQKRCLEEPEHEFCIFLDKNQFSYTSEISGISYIDFIKAAGYHVCDKGDTWVVKLP